MEQALEELVRRSLAPTLSIIRQASQDEETLRRFKRVIDKRGTPLDIDEAKFRELFRQYSIEVGNLVGGDKKVELVIVKSREEWVDRSIISLQLEYPAVALPYLPLIKAAAMNQLTPQSLETFINEDPAGVLWFINSYLQHDVTFTLDPAATFGQSMVLDLNRSNIRMYAVLYTDYRFRGHVNNAAIGAARTWGNGYTKYLIAHEGTHGHLPEIGEAEFPKIRQSIEFSADLFNMIYKLGEENKEIFRKLGITNKYSTNEGYACAVFNYANNEFLKRIFAPKVDPEEFEPLPQHIREFMASYRDYSINYVVTSVNESLADFVAELILKEDKDYKFFKPIQDQIDQTQLVNTAEGIEASARRAGLPLIRTLYNKFGNKMFEILKQRLPQTPEELAQPQLYLQNSGINN